MSAFLFFSSVPGMAVPGMAVPGRDGQTSLNSYLYIGQQACFYLDYLDLATGRVLSPVPGNSYSIAVASGRASYLTVPPPGRPWSPGNPGAGGTFAELSIRPLSLAEARAALERQRNGSGWHRRRPAPQPQGNPPGKPVPAPQPAVIHHARAALEESRVAHGHYAPGGCKQCMSGGQGG